MLIAEALNNATEELRACRTTDARLEAELLLSHVLGIDRTRLFARLQDQLDEADRHAFQELLRRRLAHEPAFYILGRREFFGLEFEVSPAALIPRPETELLVEVALEWIQARGRQGGELRVVEIGTGAGAIAIALARNIRPDLQVVAKDISEEALALARRNASKHSVDSRITFVRGSLLEPTEGRFDLIVANLPYVPAAMFETLPPDIRDHEPEVALLGGESGTALIEELLSQAPDCLAPNGMLLAEHGWDQGERLREVAREYFPTADIETRTDLTGLDRMLMVRLCPD